MSINALTLKSALTGLAIILIHAAAYAFFHEEVEALLFVVASETHPATMNIVAEVGECLAKLFGSVSRITGTLFTIGFKSTRFVRRVAPGSLASMQVNVCFWSVRITLTAPKALINATVSEQLQGATASLTHELINSVFFAVLHCLHTCAALFRIIPNILALLSHSASLVQKRLKLIGIGLEQLCALYLVLAVGFWIASVVVRGMLTTWRWVWRRLVNA
jgi:hypothetical protein